MCVHVLHGCKNVWTCKLGQPSARSLACIGNAVNSANTSSSRGIREASGSAEASEALVAGGAAAGNADAAAAGDVLVCVHAEPPLADGDAGGAPREAAGAAAHGRQSPRRTSH